MVLSRTTSGAEATARTALWCVPVPELGGVARHVLDAARTGVPGWRIVVLCPEGALAVELRRLGAPVLTGPVSPADGPRAAVRTIRRILLHLRPDLLHTHLAFADLTGIAAVTGLRAGNGRRIGVVSTEHGISGVRGYFQTDALRAKVRAAAHRARLLRTDRVIAVSESTRSQVAAQWGNGRGITVIRNAVACPDKVQPAVPGLRILSLARLAPEKQIDHLLRAFARVHAEHPEATATIAGTGPEEKALRTLATELGIADAVRFPGHVESDAALAAHDVLVQLSVWENLSYSLLDAVAHGLGVVATDVGGNGEIVPRHCLVDAEVLPAVAQAIVAQGTELTSRPRVSEHRQSLQGMCEEIAKVYGEVAR